MDAEPTQPRSHTDVDVDGDGVSSRFKFSSRPRCLSYVQGSFSSIDNIEIYFTPCFGFIFFSLAKG